MPSASRWRINVTAVKNSGSWLTINEIEWRDAIGGTDLASGGSASTSAQHAGNVVSRAFDNNTSTQYQSGTGTMPVWVEYDFGTSVSPEELSIRCSTLNDCPFNLQVQYHDGSTWQTLQTVTGMPWSVDDQTLTIPINRDYTAAEAYIWRTKITAVQSAGSWASWAELQFRKTAGGADVSQSSTASASSINLGAGGPSSAFDNNTGTRWGAAGSSLTDTWVACHNSSAGAIEQIVCTASSAVGDTPTAWQLQYWDGHDWTTYWSVSGATGWTSGLSRTYTRSQALSAPLLSVAPVLYEPTVSASSSGQSLDVPLLTNTPTLYAPSVSVGAVTLAPPLLAASPTLYSPTVSSVVSLAAPLLDVAPALYAPALAVGVVTISPPLLDATPTLYVPSVATGTVTLLSPTLDASPTLYAPTVTSGGVTLQLPLVDATPSLHNPTVSVGSVELSPPLLDASAVIYAPVVSAGAVTLSLPALSAEPVAHAPTITVGGVAISAPLLNATPTLYAPVVLSDSVTVVVPLLNAAPTLYVPGVLLEGTLSFPLLDAAPALFEPSVSTTITISAPLLTHTIQLFAPAIITRDMARRLRLEVFSRRAAVDELDRTIVVQADARAVGTYADNRLVAAGDSDRTITLGTLDRAA